MFAKYWQPGFVKTRLAVSVGDAAASELCRVFSKYLVQRFAAVGDQRMLVFTPETARADFEQLAGTCWQVRPQSCGDLGQRLENHFETIFRGGATHAVVIGSDSPTLPLEYVEQAFIQLENGSEVVLGPTSDGGYYLVGARERPPPIFRDVPWSTSGVWDSTITRLHDHNIRFATLPEWYDVDELSDLQRLLGELDADEGSNELRTFLVFSLQSKVFSL